MFATILDKKITLIIGIVLVVFTLLVGGYFVFRPQTQSLSTTAAAVMNIQSSVTATGQIDSNQDVSLSFQNAGAVASVDVAVGDHVYAGETLASLDIRGLSAQLAGAQADVLSAQANLQSLQNGATPQTLAVYNQSVSTAASALSTSLEDAYLKVSDAILNKSDTLFQNPTTANPTIIIPVDSYSTGLALNSARIDIGTRFGEWKVDLSSGTAESAALIAESSADLAAIQSFLGTLSAETTRLTPNNSGLPQSQIGGYLATVNAASTEANAALAEFNSAVQAYKASNDQLAVITASSTEESIEQAQAAVAKAQANVSGIQADIADSVITAPFDGIVASVAPKAGEAIAVAVPAITLVSAGDYKVDLMIPENQITDIRIGDPVTLSFNAGPNLTATATVASIDLAPTMTDGIGAYKTTLSLPSSNPIIRVGMTVNATILGQTAEGTVAVPSSAIISESNGDFVLVETGPGVFTRQQVQAGLSDGDYTGIVSGLSAGAMVATFGNTNQ